MQTFTDQQGQEWRLDITPALARRIRAETGIGVWPSVPHRQVRRLAKDAAKLVHVLWLCVEQQAQGRGIEPEQFAAALGGDVICNATVALMRAIVTLNGADPILHETAEAAIASAS